MWRFLPAFLAPIAVLITLFAGGVIGPASLPLPPSASPDPAPSPPVSDVGGQVARDASIDRAADLQRRVSDLQDLVAQVNQQLLQGKAQSSIADTGGQQGPDAPQVADLQRQNDKLHNELQELIAQLDQELQLELQSPPASDVAEQREWHAALDGFRHEIADVRLLDNALKGLMAHHGTDVAQHEAPTPSVPDAAGNKQTSGDPLEHQAAYLRSQIADLQRQDDALQRQLAGRKEELARSAQEMAQHTHDLSAARAEAEELRRSTDQLRQQRQAEEELLALEKLQDTLRQRRQAEAAVSPPPKAQEQRATTAPAQPAAPQGATQAMPPVPAR